MSEIHRERQAGHAKGSCVLVRACVRERKAAEHARVFACDNMVVYVNS